MANKRKVATVRGLQNERAFIYSAQPNLFPQSLLSSYSYPSSSPQIRPYSNQPYHPPSLPLPKPPPSIMQTMFELCRADNWSAIESQILSYPSIALTPMIMVNHISTTILHQAITSKGDTTARAAVITAILRVSPKSAAMKNGYGSLPLHVVTQRNIKMSASVKEVVICDLIRAFPGALVAEGGVGRRTPLHIAFTDYISPNLARIMISSGPRATTMKDKKGWLPLHVACSRHCSPEKLQLLLDANPFSLYEKTFDGDTALSLAESTATKSHPNFALIEMLGRKMAERRGRERNDATRNRSGGEEFQLGTMQGHWQPHAAPPTLCVGEDGKRRKMPIQSQRLSYIPSDRDITLSHLLLHFHKMGTSTAETSTKTSMTHACQDDIHSDTIPLRARVEKGHGAIDWVE